MNKLNFSFSVGDKHLVSQTGAATGAIVMRDPHDFPTVLVHEVKIPAAILSQAAAPTSTRLLDGHEKLRSPIAIYHFVHLRSEVRLEPCEKNKNYFYVLI